MADWHRGGNNKHTEAESRRQRFARLGSRVLRPGSLPWVTRYGLAVAASMTALMLDLLSKSMFGETTAGLFVLAAMVSAWYGGLGPGVAAIAAADLFNVIFFYNPHFSLSLGAHGYERLAVFSMVGLLVSWLTSRKRVAEEELRELNEELEMRVTVRTAALLESNNQLEEFCRTLAHDLRAPLRSMQGFAYLLLEENGRQLDATGRDYAQRIATSSERMGELILDLLEYSQISRAEYRLEKIDLTRLVQSILERSADEIETVHGVITQKTPLPGVMGDRGTLENALINLISNALKFRDPQTPPRVQIWAEAGAERVRLWVEDNGIGIAPEYQERIFGVFERLHKNDAYPGTGIGLAMVKKAVERMGGGVGVESTLGKGSRFWIELPKG
jgi:signal transduction histidine kinase